MKRGKRAVSKVYTGRNDKSRMNHTEEKLPKNSKQLNDIFAQCIVPKMNRINGKPYPRVDTGLDSYLLNYHIAEARSKTRDEEVARRKKNPLTYPTKDEKLRDQRRAVPTHNTL